MNPFSSAPPTHPQLIPAVGSYRGVMPGPSASGVSVVTDQERVARLGTLALPYELSGGEVCKPRVLKEYETTIIADNSGSMFQKKSKMLPLIATDSEPDYKDAFTLCLNRQNLSNDRSIPLIVCTDNKDEMEWFCRSGTLSIDAMDDDESLMAEFMAARNVPFPARPSLSYNS